MQPPPIQQQPAGQPSAAEEEGSSQAVETGAAAVAGAAAAASSAAASSRASSSSPSDDDSGEAASKRAPTSQREPRMIAGAELYEQHLRRALAVPDAQRDADVHSFLAAHAALEAAADALQEPEARSAGASAQGSSSGGSASSQGGSASSQRGSSAGSEERRLLATAAYLTATWATATTRGLRHPRLAEAHGPPPQVNQLLWQTVATPTISMNMLFWLPAPSVTLPNEDAKRWAAPGAPRLDARRLLLLLLLADAMSVGPGAAGALHFLAAAQRTLRSPRAAQQMAAGLAAMAARAGGGADPPSVHELSVAW